MRLVFGGSFNPVHHGHLICARAAAEACGFNRVILIPSGQPPHKTDKEILAPGPDRLKMCRLAVSGSDLFEVDDVEQRLPMPSYSIDTVRELKRRGWDKVHWLIGADMLLYLPNWHEAGQLIRETEFIVMARPGWTLDWQTLPPEFRFLEKNVVRAPLIEISASDIRVRVATGRSVDYLTPPAVCRYIRERGLYRQSRDPGTTE